MQCPAALFLGGVCPPTPEGLPAQVPAPMPGGLAEAPLGLGLPASPLGKPRGREQGKAHFRAWVPTREQPLWSHGCRAAQPPSAPPTEGGRGSPALPCGGCGPRPSPASWPHPSQDAHTPRLAPSFSETLGSVLPSLSKEEGHPSSGTPPGGLSGCLRDLGGRAGEGLCLGRP